MNTQSSRSHAILQVTLKSQSKDGCRRAKLNLVDLAGSEKWNKQAVKPGVEIEEMKNINTSLSALGNCIAALTQSGRKHIPYRDSSLTRLLQDSLGGNTRTVLIATITPRASDETLRTIQFADRTRALKQKLHELAEQKEKQADAVDKVHKYETQMREKELAIERLHVQNGLYQQQLRDGERQIQMLMSQVQALSTPPKARYTDMDTGNQTPQLQWRKIECSGEAPSRRSGHTLTIVGSNGFLFGGCDYAEPPGPTNDLFQLRIHTNGSCDWSRVAFRKGPLPRWKHSATLVDNKIFLFGGFHNATTRFQDVWIFNPITMEWSQPVPQATPRASMAQVTKASLGWPGCPAPRGGHTASLINREIFIFGGYGGQGYSRRDFDDLYALNVDTMAWGKVSTKGKGPERRSGHQACAVDTTLFVFGGWNCTTQFNDLHIFDTETSCWSSVDGSHMNHTSPRWNHSSCAVLAIPNAKIFCFGGVLGQMNEYGAPGMFANDISVLDTGTFAWTVPEINGTPPAPRADTTLAYDDKGSRLMICGGWANLWFNDVFSLDVSCVVGPPYAITGVRPSFGAITGGLLLILEGIDFTPKPVIVRFSCRKGTIDVPGTYVTDQTLTVTTPDFSMFPPGDVQIRVALQGDSFTTTFQLFNFFAVTCAAKTLAFGAGVLSGGASAEPITFFLQACDANGHHRTRGGDEFQASVRSLADDKELQTSIQDMDDGTYAITYTAPIRGEYEITVQFCGTFGGVVGTVYGFPLVVTFDDAMARDMNRMTGKLVMDGLSSDLVALTQLIEECGKGLELDVGLSGTPAEETAALIQLKEHLFTVDKKGDQTRWLLEKTKSLLAFLATAVDVEKERNQLTLLETSWTDLVQKVPVVAARIAPRLAAQSSRTKGDITVYHEKLLVYAAKMKHKGFWEFETGMANALHMLDEAAVDFAKEDSAFKRMRHVAEIFECLALMEPSEKIVQHVARTLERLRTVWTVVGDISRKLQMAMELLWVDLDGAVLEDEAKGMMNLVKSAGKEKEIKDSNVYQGLEALAHDFLVSCPLYQALRHPSIQSRHWVELMQVTVLIFETRRLLVQQTFPNPIDHAELKFADIMELKLHRFQKDIEDLTERAQKESRVELALQEVDARWSTISFDVTVYKDTQVPILRIRDEDIEVLEADQVMLQSMLSSRVQFFKGLSEAWSQKLTCIGDVTVALGDIQRTWSYLEPLFIGSEEVKRELPDDAAQFIEIDTTVKEILTSFAEAKVILTACTARPHQLQELATLTTSLQKCQNSLIEFLDGKRRLFPRFYFTSEADLLDILSNGGTPDAITKHLSKVFLATQTFKFDTPSTITHFVSNVGKETIRFVTPVTLSGKVEGYLTDALNGMKLTLKENIKSTIRRYPQLSRTDWLMSRTNDGALLDAAQVVLLVSGMEYVKSVEAALVGVGSGHVSALSELLEKVTIQLNDLIKLTRGSLHDEERQRVMCMITMDAHSRDVIQSLISQHVTSLASFVWQAQLKPRLLVTDHTSLDICDASFEYGLEYLGNGARLVITPLTDRMYVTATQALNLHLGCAPSGPAGTGKTETTKDLASSLGKPWDTVVLDPTCGTFITMNPGYLGRSELPEGLKALFRPITVMLPDLCLICENMLMAQGFTEAKSLASKFYHLYHLCKELLSQQEHYDWGLRAIKSILLITGSLKRNEPTLSESQLLLRALRDFNVPKLVMQAQPIFHGLLHDLFPEQPPPRKVNVNLEKHIQSACETLGLWPEESFRLKVVQLEELLVLRHCVFVMGPAGSGKSECILALQTANGLQGTKVKLVDINPKVVSTDELYGSMHVSTREWKDGLLSKVMRDLANDDSDQAKWLVLDGDLDANWIESMNSVMDDNKTLTLASNERIPLKKYMRLIFEIRDLAYATPATVSRAGILYLSADEGTQHESFLASWLSDTSPDVEVRARLGESVMRYVGPCLAYVKKLKTIVPVQDISLVQGFLHFLDATLNTAVVDDPKKIEIVCGFASIWAFGAALCVSDDGTDYRKLFSEWWRAEFKGIKVPIRDTVFDYYLNPATLQFDSWRLSPFFTAVKFDGKDAMHAVTVPTTETVSMLLWTSKMISEAHGGSTFGPVVNGAQWIYFLDDLNLPMVDPYHTQSALALLRQLMDYNHWYDRIKFTVKQVVDCQFVSCMNPTGGSFYINPRLQRHFVTFAVALPSATSKFVLLWLHESARVYGDRLVSQSDLNKYNALAQHNAKKLFPSVPVQKYFAQDNADSLVFCPQPMSAAALDLDYDQVTSLPDMKVRLEEALADYNMLNAKMDLVLFKDAIEHVARIMRIISIASGHAMLVGVGGSGRKSLARLSAHLVHYAVVDITITQYYSLTDFKSDLQAIFGRAGVKGEKLVFLLSDSDIKNERMLVYINDLLSSGAIADLYTAEEQDAIVAQVVMKFKGEKDACWAYFLHQLKENVHCVLCFSPAGSTFRGWARKFPALVNCTIIDWFQPWPVDALQSVAVKCLSTTTLHGDTLAAVEQFMPHSFDAVNVMAEKFKLEEGRIVYTTPKTYLEFLALYTTLLVTKQHDMIKAIFRLQSGLDKLESTSHIVANIEEDLSKTLEEAMKKKAIAEEMADVVAADKLIVEQETEKANVEAQKCAVIHADMAVKKADTESDLAAAQPMVDAAMAALDTLNRKDLGNCKTMSKPPAGVGDIFASVLVLFAGINPDVPVQKNGKIKEKDRAWENCKKILLANVNGLIDELKNFKNLVDTNAVPEANWKEIRPLLELPHFNVEIIEKRNSAAAGLCAWVINIVLYYDVLVTIEPKRKALQEITDKYTVANEKLAAVQTKVQGLQERLTKLTAAYEQTNEDVNVAIATVERGKIRMNLAKRLTAALGTAAFVSYAGPFTKPYRELLVNSHWRPFLLGLKKPLALHVDATPVSMLTPATDEAAWVGFGLPSDRVSIENGTIVQHCKRWPLMIDPQLQAIHWLRAKEALVVVRQYQPNLVLTLEAAIENGQSLLLENIEDKIDPLLWPVISRRKVCLKLGDKVIEWAPSFRLYLHTTMANPHYAPEIQAETTLVNFSVTPHGLEDQLLSLVIRKEWPKKAKARTALIQQQNRFKITMQELEDKILNSLADAEGDVTENVTLIGDLETTKATADALFIQAKNAADIELAINQLSARYQGVARRGALLFFVLNNLHKLHAYHVFSLNAFVVMFQRGMDSSKGHDDDKKPTSALSRFKAVAKRVIVSQRFHWNVDVLLMDRILEEAHFDMKAILDSAQEEVPDESVIAPRCLNLQSSITEVVFDYVRRGLFEKDKLVVATQLCLAILKEQNKISPAADETTTCTTAIGILNEWLPELAWSKLRKLEELVPLLTNEFKLDGDEWKDWYQSDTPESDPMPGKARTPLVQLLLIRSLRPDRLLVALSTFIESHMGSFFIHQPPFDLESIYQEASASTPLFFILFPGVDPTADIEQLGKRFQMTADRGNFALISMGQGQEGPAERTLEKFAAEGSWIVLQNIHLMPRWLPQLTRILDQCSHTADTNFRCFLSAEAPGLSTVTNIPETLLQVCIKVANEAPADLKSNLSRAWASFSLKTIETSLKPSEYQGCLFALCFYHAVILGRKRFGCQGWSRPYSFNQGDLTLCADVLRRYMDKTLDDKLPWDDLRYIFGEIMYGGHITDFWDRLTNKTYLEVLFKEDVLKSKDLMPGLAAPDPYLFTYSKYAAFIDTSLPVETPSIFGLHPNTEIQTMTNACSDLFLNLQRVGSAMLGIATSSNQHNPAISNKAAIVQSLTSQLPSDFDLSSLQEQAQPMLEQGHSTAPYVVVALQECTRMNTLLQVMRQSLNDLIKGMNGQLNMTDAMEELLESMSLQQVPGRNPLHMWFADLLERVAFLTTWVTDWTLPTSMWLSGLFNPAAFLTAVKQVTARNLDFPLDNMTIETHILNTTAVTSAATKGFFVHGLYLEGARWFLSEDADELQAHSYTIDDLDHPCAGYLSDAVPKEVTSLMPVVYIRAVSIKEDWEATATGYFRHDTSVYECPVYMTSQRGPTFVFLATLSTKVAKAKWIMAGVALLLQKEG
ncbi:hypothetical protein DYB37_003140 [Aphanomyces astaci]|uniref:Kinesin motor domain-containing protein n=1 Tax=Aphanomyces astaci TaxID=112090 RepID=A0A418EQ39_APHAT|nr:hypothetical protein DYB37_003140 [Aphanomyces astaci]